MDLIPFSISEYSLESYLIKINVRSRIIYWIIITIIVAILCLLPIINVDISVQARGYFQSEIERQTVLTSFQGKVLFASVRNGEYVKKGDTLLIIDCESVKAQRNSLLERINENDSSINDLEKLTMLSINGDNTKVPKLVTRRYRAEFSNLSSLQHIQLQKYLKRKTEHERNELLYRQQIIAKTEFENSLYALNSEKDNLRQILTTQISLWQNDLTLRKNESVKLYADLKQSAEELTNRIILAPANGEIIQSSDIQAGSTVYGGQKIAEITPDGDLVAIGYVRPADIGLVRENQKVKIQVDAFNHNEWGMLSGDIIDISDDMIVENGSSAYFRVKCKPDRTYLKLNNGYKAEIKKGMSLNIRIFVIRRSLYHLLFDKADKWFNPYTYSKNS